MYYFIKKIKKHEVLKLKISVQKKEAEVIDDESQSIYFIEYISKNITKLIEYHAFK